MSTLKEKEIPVFTVWKNNSILKNIFLINNPPNFDDNQENDENRPEIHRELEETLLVGRHPDCDIRLEHPSVSRFHLRIHSLPSSNLLFITDLSSVHGTWVSGRRIEPNIRTMVKEGDHLRIGGSSRVYKLHWIPLSLAYDVSKPFVPPLDLPDQHEDEDELIKDEISGGLKDEEVKNNVDISKGLEFLNLCGRDQMVPEEVLSQAPQLLPQKPVSVKDEGTELADVSYEALASPCFDGISRELEQKGMLLEPVTGNDESENEDVAVKDEGTKLAEYNLEGLAPPCFDGVSRELEQKEMLLELLISNEECENEDVQSMDSILEGLVPLFMGENWEWVGQEDSHPQSSEDDETRFANPVSEKLNVAVVDENSEVLGQKVTSSAPLIPEDMDDITADGRQELVPEILGEGVDDHAWSFSNTECQPLCPDLKGSDTLFLDENFKLLAQRSTSPAPLIPDYVELSASENVGNITAEEKENLVHEIVGEDVMDNAWSYWCGARLASECHQPDTEHEKTENESENMDNISVEEKDESVCEILGEDVMDNAWSYWRGARLASECHQPDIEHEKTENESENMDNISVEEKDQSVCEIVGEDVMDNAWSYWCGSRLSSECHQLGVENEKKEATESAEAFLRNVSTGNATSDLNSPAKEHRGSELWSFWSGKMGVESVCSALSDAEPFSDSEYKSLPDGHLSSPMISSEQKSACSFWSEREKPENKSCFQSPKSVSSVIGRLGSPLMTSDQNPMDSIWLRRGKLASTPQFLTSRTGEKERNTDQKDVKGESISMALFHGIDDQEAEEVFTPDKENFTPTTHKSMRKFTILKEINNSSSGKSPLFKMTCSPDNGCVDIFSPLSNKENYSPRAKEKRKTATRGSVNRVRSVKLKERKGVRMPFESLLADSPQKGVTECHIAESETKSARSVGFENIVTSKEKCAREELRQWNMVVDTTTLLNKESRKALQLLEGLKGTQLIIPRIVITELSSLKRQASFFRRNTEVLSALEWIQDCMLKTGWWIRVQNSMEEARPVAPTPPASPQTGSYSFSGFESRREVLSPTVEDDVLEFALGFRKTNHDGQLVLLSDDITMKIKAMAEGMMCETGEEFRESLVNPFSERFMWTDSSPRGQTWSCADDFVLKEKFYPSSLKMMTPKSRENVKGLKLILLHNSRYHEQMTAIH
ncbi:hypothetical protein RND81_06G050300 [Saponaria officinalis]|uniref:FHA domain-containing protein n=1 Tax=Saponaria officinalis TaxID=3572 RepID=A0AAW1K4A1_SAPOF